MDIFIIGVIVVVLGVVFYKWVFPAIVCWVLFPPSEDNQFDNQKEDEYR